MTEKKTSRRPKPIQGDMKPLPLSPDGISDETMKELDGITEDLCAGVRKVLTTTSPLEEMALREAEQERVANMSPLDRLAMCAAEELERDPGFFNITAVETKMLPHGYEPVYPTFQKTPLLEEMEKLGEAPVDEYIEVAIKSLTNAKIDNAIYQYIRVIKEAGCKTVRYVAGPNGELGKLVPNWGVKFVEVVENK